MVPISGKMGYIGKGLDLWADPPRINILLFPALPPDPSDPPGVAISSSDFLEQLGCLANDEKCFLFILAHVSAGINKLSLMSFKRLILKW